MKRDLSLPNDVSSSIVNKAKASCDLTDEDGNSDPEDRVSPVSEICGSEPHSGGFRKRFYKQMRKPTARNVAVTEAEVLSNSDPSVIQSIAKLSVDMYMIYSTLNERMDKLESRLEQNVPKNGAASIQESEYVAKQNFERCSCQARFV